jgi:hypothetical protein
MHSTAPASRQQAAPPPAHVALDTETNDLALPCPVLVPPRAPADGLVISPGTIRVPDEIPVRAPQLRLGGLRGYVDPSAALGTLVLFVPVPGRKQPVKVVVGLGEAWTVERILGPLNASS